MSLAKWQGHGKLFETIEIWSNATLLLSIHDAELVSIRTIEDIKQYLEGVTGIPQEEIVLCHIPTGMVYKDKQRLPVQQVQLFSVNILRVDFHVKYSAKSEGVETIGGNVLGQCLVMTLSSWAMVESTTCLRDRRSSPHGLGMGGTAAVRLSRLLASSRGRRIIICRRLAGPMADAPSRWI
ncbi:hypothetical protein BX070DRAFT_253878 [Coemansia spiralis]|nr:hypothetical protein BX070DRAFT_253878 [Coemansia spiralis]